MRAAEPLAPRYGNVLGCGLVNHCDPAELREPYSGAPLHAAGLPAEPMDLFAAWFEDAAAAGLAEPNAMVVGTVDADGTPRSRTVLLKGFDRDGLRFYTNLRSRKAAALRAEPRASLLFPWHPMRRQVLVTGRAEPLGAEENDRYFRSRPRGSQIGAWASAHQSSPVPDRAALDAAYAHWAGVWGDREEVQRPDYWGGYLVRPVEMEFWQGGGDRMHDRFHYRRSGRGWAVERLAP